MAIVRSQRAAITAVLSARRPIEFKEDTLVLSAVRVRGGRLLPVSVAGISQGDSGCSRLKTTAVTVLDRQKLSVVPETITIKKDSRCVLIEKVSGGPGNQRSVTELIPARRRYGGFVFQKIGKSEAYSANVC